MGLVDPIGKTIRVWGQEQIVGIAKNFHFESLFEEVKPCIMQLEPRAQNMMVKINSELYRQLSTNLINYFYATEPGMVFEYKFVDDDYQALYVGEKRVGILFDNCRRAIFISCLGLFGLETLSCLKNEKKKISIRKILGAGEYSIIQLLSNEFEIVLVAIIIALPASYMIIENWIKKFAYGINISLGGFLLLPGCWLWELPC